MEGRRHVPSELLRVSTEETATAIAAYGRARCGATDLRLLVRDRYGDLVGPYPGAHRRTLPVDETAALVERVRRELARPVDEVVALVDGGALAGIAIVAGRTAPAATLEELVRVGGCALALHLEVRDLREHSAGLEAMLETARTLASEEHARAVLRSIVARARRVVGSEVASLALVSGGETRLQAAVGNTNPFFDHAVVRSGVSLVGTVAATGEALVTSDFLDDDRFVHLAEVDRAVEAEGLRSVLGVPMRVGGEIVGVLCVSNRRRGRRFARRDVEIMSGLADHAALAYRNAERYEEARATAVRLDRLHRQVSRRNEELRTAAAMHDTLTDLVLEDVGLDAFVAGVADIAGRPVVVRHAAAEIRAGCDAVAAADGWTDVPIAAAGEVLGTLALGGANDDRALSAAQQAARAAALVILRARAVDEAEDRLRGELADELLDADVPAERALRRGHRLGVDLDRALRLAVSVPLPGDGPVRPLVRDEAGLVGAVHRRRQVIVVLDEAFDETRLERLLLSATAAQRPARLALVGPAASVDGLRRLHSEALRCLEVAEALDLPGAIVTPERLGVRFLLAGAEASPHVVRFLERVLGPLAQGSSSMDLLATLESLFAHGGNVLATARALHVHPNTLYHRLARIRERTGLDPRDANDAFELQLALRLRG